MTAVVADRSWSDNRRVEHLKAIMTPTLIVQGGIDGAIVLTYDCKVAAFNSIIARLEVSGPRLVNEHGRNLRRDDLVGKRGSRHQSALSYALAVPNSFAFVISQDGGISGFQNSVDGTVLCQVGMRVMD
jgi:hypothetical protein